MNGDTLEFTTIKLLHSGLQIGCGLELNKASDN